MQLTWSSKQVNTAFTLAARVAGCRKACLDSIRKTTGEIFEPLINKEK